jgi:hypothetical protein
MSNLKDRLVKLAHEVPELRKHLLPILRVASKEHLILGDGIRIKWFDHPDNRMVIEELPKKPVKKQLDRAEIEAGWFVQSLGYGAGDSFLMSNLVHDAQLHSSMNFDAAVAAMKKSLEEAKDRVLKNENLSFTEDWFKQTGWAHIIRSKPVSWLTVEPHDYQPIVAKGKDFTVTSEWNDFKAYSPRSFPEDDPNTYGGDPHWSSLGSKSSGGARKLFTILKADPTALKEILWSKFSEWLTKNKIAFGYSHSNWS